MRLPQTLFISGIIFCIVLCFVITTQAASGLIITPVFSTYNASINQPCVIVFTVQNMNNEPLSADVHVVVPPGWMEMLAINQVVIEAESEESIFLTLMIPQSTPAGDYEVMIYLVEQDGSLLAQGYTVVEIGPSRGVTGTFVSTIDILSGQSIEVPLTLHNRGNITEQIKLEYTIDGNLTIDGVEPVILLAPGQKIQVRLNIDCPVNIRTGFFRLFLSIQSVDGIIFYEVESRITVKSKPSASVGKESMTPAILSWGQFSTTYSRNTWSSRLMLEGYGSYFMPVNQEDTENQRSLSEISYRLNVENSKTETSIQDVLFKYISGSIGFEGGLLNSPGTFLNYSGAGVLLTKPTWYLSPSFLFMTERGTGNLRVGGKWILYTSPIKVELASSTSVGENPSVWTELGFMTQVDIIKGLALRGVIAEVNSGGAQSYGGQLSVNYSKSLANITLEAIKYPEGYRGTTRWSIMGRGVLTFPKSSYILSVRSHALGDSMQDVSVIVRNAEFQSRFLLATNTSFMFTAQASKRENLSLNDLLKPWNISYKSLLKHITTYRGLKFDWSIWMTNRVAAFLFENEYGVSLFTEINMSPKRTIDVRVVNTKDQTELQTDLVWTTNLNDRFRYIADIMGSIILPNEERTITHTEIIKLNSIYDLSDTTTMNLGIELAHYGASWNWKVMGSINYMFDLPMSWIQIGGVLHGRVLLFTKSDDTLENAVRYEGLTVFVGSDQNVTNSEGEVVFYLPAGLHNVKTYGLPAGYVARIPEAVNVDDGATTHVDIFVYKVGRISGRVFVDVNSDHVYSSDENGMGGIRILAVHTGTQEAFEVYTRADGMFDITDLIPGQYHVMVDPEWIPSGYEGGYTGPEIITLNGGENKYVEFSIAEKRKTIVFAVLPTEARFSWSPKTPRVNQIVKFYDESIWDFSQDITAYHWDFGDGTTSNEQNPTHAYDVAGEYEVSLVIVDTLGESSKASAVITILP